jgi:MFS transporter, PAT family, beta-lactamase induction signal transducer AmpG
MTVSTAAAPTQPAPAGWREVLNGLRQRRVAVMLGLGFASGLPFLLVGNTLGFWLREDGLDLATIGFLSWVGLAYSFKFLWAPVIDRVDAPLFGRLGRRRGWMALSQSLIGLSLIGMAMVGPTASLAAFAVFSLVAAFASATQDVVVDGWRIESADAPEQQSLLTAAHQLGYRAALLTTDALILFLAAEIGWPGSYLAFGVAMAVGLLATAMASEPLRQAVSLRAGQAALWTARGLADAIVGPFVAFFRTHGRLALLMLATISLYRLSDFIMGPMANPLYVDSGISKEMIGSVRATVGLTATLAGIAAAGLLAIRIGFGRTLVLGAVLGPGSNLGFCAIALAGPDPTVFAAAIILDNFSVGFAGTALTVYMSSLTSIGYTATQYALLSSFYALLGKFLKGFSGQVVEGLAAQSDQTTAYAQFFAGTAAIGIPAVILCLVLDRKAREKAARARLSPLNVGGQEG